MKIKNLLLLLLVVIPVGVIFRQLFTLSPLAWGDAPYFYNENLRQLYSIPFVWDIRTHNFGASYNQLLWLFLPTYLMGLLNNFTGLNHEVLVRVIFYFPSLIAGMVGMWLFSSFITLKKFPRVLAVVFYILNSYFLMLVDGGQIGVALAYGILPLFLYFFFRFIKTNLFQNSVYSLICLVFLLNTDLRIAILALLFSVITIISPLPPLLREERITGLKKLFIINLSALGISLFWLWPFILSLFNPGLQLNVASLSDNFIKLLDSLLIHQPHFPINQYGLYSAPPFYYGIFLILFLLGLFVDNKGNDRRLYAKYFLLFLCFAFLAKGNNEPFGKVYDLLVNYLPLGQAFRDSSKFFVLEILVVSQLLAILAIKTEQAIKNGFRYLALSLLYLFLLLLVFPAFTNGLTGTFGVSGENKDYEFIYKQIQKDPASFRTLWFPEKPPLGFTDWRRPALSANLLSKERPFATNIAGTYDLFYFLHDPYFDKWLSLLGIKYVYFPEDQRKKIYTPDEVEDRQKFLSFVAGLKTLLPLSWPVGFNSYLVRDPEQHIFAQKKAFLIVGGDDIYSRLFAKTNFRLSSYGFFFAESGRIPIADLSHIDETSLSVIFNNKDKNDLVMSGLLDSFISMSKAEDSDWGYKRDFLDWKYELLKAGIDNHEFDYGLGVAFSSVKEEEMQFALKSKSSEKVYLGVRYLNATDSAGIKLKINNNEKDLPRLESKFGWFIEGPLDQGRLDVSVTNKGGFNAVNALVLVSEEKLNEEKALIDAFIAKHDTAFLKNGESIPDTLLTESSSIPIVSWQQNPTSYHLILPEQANWLTFTDSYNLDWSIGNIKPLPGYEMVNTFYIKSLDRDKYRIAGDEYAMVFDSQQHVNQGIILSGIALVVVFILLYRVYPRKHDHKES